jgi:hypothetical protein
MTGRAVRSNTGFATSFVLDSEFERYVITNEEIIPA